MKVKKAWLQFGQGLIKIDPKRFKTVRKMFDLVLTNCYSVPKILDIVNNKWKMENQFGRKVTRNIRYPISESLNQ